MKKVVIVLVIISVVGLMVFFNISKKSSSNQEEGTTSESSSGFGFGKPKSLEVKAIAIKKSSISSSILITGNVEVVDKKDITVSSAMKVTKVLVEVGDKVQQGTALFSVDITSLSDELASLKINRDIQNLQLKKIEGAKATSSSESANIAIELSKLSLASAQAAYESQLQTIAENTLLYNEGIISKSEIESLEKATPSLLQQVEIAQLNLERSENDLAQLQKSNNDSTKSLAIDVQIQLKNLESLDMSITKIEKQLTDIEQITKAPVGGTITSIMIDDDQMIMSGTPLMTIQDMDHLVVKAMIREYDISSLAVGQEVLVTGDAVGKDAKVSGKISFISPVAVDTVINGRQTTGIEIKIDIIEGIEFLKPGYTADCEIKTQNKENVLLVSFDVFREDKDNNKVVYVVKDGFVEERIITLGITSDFDAEVLTGLSEGEIVVVNPSLTIKDGAAVTVTMESEEEGE